MKNLLYILTFIILLFTTACESTIDNEEFSTIKENSLTGDWIINAQIDNDSTFGPFDINIRMTSNNDSISLKDEGTFWGFQLKAAVNKSNDTFESTISVNELSEVGSNIKLLNGKLIGNDSISFDIQFEDDVTPYGLTYNLKGRRKS